MFVSMPRGLRDYVLESDRELPEEHQTRFKIDDLTEKQRVKVMNSMEISPTETGEVSVTGTGTRVYEVVKECLKGWDNLLNAKSRHPIACRFDGPGGRISDESLALLPWEVKQEIANEIMDAATPTEDDKEKPEPSQEG